MPEEMKPNRSPFNSPLHEGAFVGPDYNHDRDARLRELEDNDKLIVRVERESLQELTDNQKESLKQLHSNYENNPKDEDTKQAYLAALDAYAEIDEATRYRDHLQLLQDKYKIKNSGYMPVVGNDPQDGQAKRFIVTNRIRGASAEENLEQIPEEAILDIFHKILRYFRDTYKEGGAFIVDFGLEQFVYDPKYNEMVLVDHEPKFLAYLAANSKNDVGAQLDLLEGEVARMEQAYGHAYPDLQQEIKHLLD